ncbi:MAG TPA: hypothetical protein VIL86_01515 [Tepidisphaeraceae bacterium]|jgi:hypothetical protein
MSPLIQKKPENNQYLSNEAGPPRALPAAGVLVVFGASDWFEAKTDNEWWHPWWLLLWKAACVIALATIAVIAYRRERLRKLYQ